MNQLISTIAYLVTAIHLAGLIHESKIPKIVRARIGLALLICNIAWHEWRFIIAGSLSAPTRSSYSWGWTFGCASPVNGGAGAS